MKLPHKNFEIHNILGVSFKIIIFKRRYNRRVRQLFFVKSRKIFLLKIIETNHKNLKMKKIYTIDTQTTPKSFL